MEKKRYPDISDIVQAAKTANLGEHKITVTDADSEFTVSEDFIKLVEKKGYSIFRLIDETDYQIGLEALKRDFENHTTIHSNHGETLLWIEKSRVK